MAHPLLLTLLPFFFFISLLAQSDNSGYTGCRQDSCGNVDISYPFWKMGSESTTQFCGYEGFGINCSKNGDRNVSKITLGADSYYVQDIDYRMRTMVLTDYDVSPLARVPNKCPRVLHNVTLGTLPLGFTADGINLTFHYACNGCPSFATEISCLEDNNGKACLGVMNTTMEESKWAVANP